ncbi:regulator [Sporosarcina newyorkensis 2681]|uniref:Regulator n=1 Tax=Sporosarcina newyorkensis 2681 TaxID=1027292 RepID=F9DXL4_9BACL|nr:XylR N-terminal domain-containing protein [Sporosarcina newyorkensis]EGQ20432.1 regulator [Sporosarcina newyorkensis 2681]
MRDKQSIQIDSESEKIVNIPESAIGSLLPASDLSTLRKVLIETIGVEQTREFFFRYGWHSGVKDAGVMVSIYRDNIEGALLAGPKMHFHSGYVKKTKTTLFERDEKKGTLHWEVRWEESSEAKEHIELFGFSDHGVCHKIIGYATGYISAVIGEKVIIHEVECEGMGHEACRFVCFTERELNEKAEEEIKILEERSNSAESDQTYEQLKSERDNLVKVNQIYEKLMNQNFSGNSLSSIAKELHRAMKLPVLIEDKNRNLLETAGISREQAELNKSYGNNELIMKTKYVGTDSEGHRLSTPIFIKRKIVGYCSFLYQNTWPQEVDKLILERAALACSVNLFNERINSDTSQQIRGSFLEEIITGGMNMREAAKKAYYLGFDLEPTYFMIAIQPISNKNSPLESLELAEKLINWLGLYFQARGINVLIGKKIESILILISDKALLSDPLSKRKLSKELHKESILQFPEYQFIFGISSTSEEIDDVSRLYEESIASLKVANCTRNIILFESLGIVGFLLQMKNATIIQKYRLDILIEEDRNKNTELTKTLYHYLNNGCNLNRTARVMNFSTSGLRYRLQRLSDILQVDINKPTISYQLFTALQFLILLEDLDFGNDVVVYDQLEGI